MLRASLPIGRIFNVDLRMHISFPLLLLLAVGYSVALNGGVWRGFSLWLALCFAVLVREIARAIAAAYAGLRPRAIYLLPIGGLMAFSTQDGATPLSAKQKAATRLLAWTGPAANITFGLLLMGASYALVPEVNLIAQPWIATSHILRSFVWMQIILGAVSLLPLPSLSARAETTPATAATPEAATRSFPLKLPTIGFGTALALIMIVSGALLMNLWLVFLGAFMLLGAQISTAHQKATTAGGDNILVREVMLTEYTLLSSSDTLQGALERTVHSLQDVFPVVRGDRLVGSIARQTIASRLVTDGDSYLQGIIRKASAIGASEFIPVVEDDTMIGILTPQSLTRAVQQIKVIRPLHTQENDRD
jgi:hypothetical protein